MSPTFWPIEPAAGAMVQTSLERLRPLVLAWPEVSEAAHLGTPDFRCRGKIFASASSTAGRAVLKLPVHIQQAMVLGHPGAFSLPKGWGRHGWTNVETELIDADLLKDLLELAWRQVAPKHLAATFAQRSEKN